MTEIAWEDAEQGLDMATSTVATEKNRELLFIATCFTNGDIVFSLVFQRDELLKIANLIPSKKPDFAMEKISSPRERRKWSLNWSRAKLKGAWPNVRTESK